MGKYNARKRKTKKNIPAGTVHIKSTFNNTLVTITDPEGRVIGERTTQADGTVTGGLELTSNSFTYEGVNFNLLKASPNEEVSITVAKDVDKIFDNVVKFVDKYNEKSTCKYIKYMVESKSPLNLQWFFRYTKNIKKGEYYGSCKNASN